MEEGCSRADSPIELPRGELTVLAGIHTSPLLEPTGPWQAQSILLEPLLEERILQSLSHFWAKDIAG